MSPRFIIVVRSALAAPDYCYHVILEKVAKGNWLVHLKKFQIFDKLLLKLFTVSLVLLVDLIPVIRFGFQARTLRVEFYALLQHFVANPFCKYNTHIGKLLKVKVNNYHDVYYHISDTPVADDKHNNNYS